MKFPRSTRLFRGQLDLAPFLCVLFLLAAALLLRDFLVLPRGARLALPPQDSPVAAAAGERVLIVAVDAARRLYFENQIIARDRLETALAERSQSPGASKTLLIQPDQSVPYGELAELAVLARRAGMQQIIFGSGSGRAP
ncbi:MAG: biopolymer transporter ExbD [Verrucomicrobiales bacterium]|nr:biopolymer transporter ExbD [Verrucomicrobiales bacterium]